MGIGWFESLAELMERTEIPVYILEEVYLRFCGAFDAVTERVFIVTDRAEAYGAYNHKTGYQERFGGGLQSALGIGCKIKTSGKAGGFDSACQKSLAEFAARRRQKLQSFSLATCA